MIELDIVPIPKPRMTRGDKWRSRPCTERYWAFKDELNLLLQPEDLPETCHLIFVLPMPESWSKKKKQETLGKPHLSKPDGDNLVKAFFDAVFPDNDSFIWDFRCSKVWGKTGKILINPIPPLTITL